jgi:hypothetical protein
MASFAAWLRVRPLLLLALLLGAPSGAHAFCLATTVDPPKGELCSDEGLPLFWKRQCITFSVMDPGKDIATLAQAQSVADRSFGAWLDVECGGRPLGLDVEQTEEAAECLMPQYNKHGANANSVLFISDWEKFEAMSSDAFGLTLVFYNPDTGSIYDADILLNETLGHLTLCKDACPPRAVDIQNVLTHEAGHFFGLGHSDQHDATMAPDATVGQLSKRDLTDDDRAGLCAIYESYATPECSDDDFTPNHGFSTKCDAPEAQGPASSSSSSGCMCSLAGRRAPGGGASIAAMLGVLLSAARRRARARSR